MSEYTRREFLAGVSAGIAAAGVGAQAADTETSAATAVSGKRVGTDGPAGTGSTDEVNFRYAPTTWQTAICFPDDHFKTLVGEKGDIRYGYDGAKGIYYFPLMLEFSLACMEPERHPVQRLEASGVPIILTSFKGVGVRWELTTFASRLPDEGRVDNVLMMIEVDGDKPVDVVPLLTARTTQPFRLEKPPGRAVVLFGTDPPKLFMAADRPMGGRGPLNFDGLRATSVDAEFEFGRAQVKPGTPLRIFFRFPQEGQELKSLEAGLAAPHSVLGHTRDFWKGWSPFGGETSISFPGKQGDFAVSCARNILQAREVKDGKFTFQVGAAQYRGLWIVDGCFLLEAARYLGYDNEAQQGLETTWGRQREDGGIFAGAGDTHWKDTAIAMFTLVRQAELAQDWKLFRDLQPNVLRAAGYIRGLRDSAKSEDSAPARYGLLPRGMGDGGLIGNKSELTNTLWTLSGLKAVADAADAQQMSEALAPVRALYVELRKGFDAAVRDEMRRHPAGFDFLPMLMKEAEDWTREDEWHRPRPQIAQWAMSHCIYPGLLFDRDDAVVQGHMRLMQESTQEDIPAETGWAVRGGAWTYNAAFVAEVYLWAGLRDWARRTFIGFLNHASPLYCWREEQPLQGQFVADFIGDMPHNWASAECVRYLRHCLALEDGTNLRLLDGLTGADLHRDARYGLTESPTRFGRVSLTFEPLNGGREWRLKFRRGAGSAPKQISVPGSFGKDMLLSEIDGNAQPPAPQVWINDAATEFSAIYRRG